MNGLSGATSAFQSATNRMATTTAIKTIQGVNIMQNIGKQIIFFGSALLLMTDLATAANPFTPQSQPTGWLSQPDVTFFDVSSGTESFYRLGFFKDTWSGNVHANHINSTARIQLTGPWDEVSPTLTTAASLLDAADYSSDRKIATFGRPFRWASLSGDQKNDLGHEPELNYIRGDRSNEEPRGSSWRWRESVLGDILHSNIMWWDHGTSKSLYVGANDGMLHSFDADTGVENWAYIPSMLIPNLNRLLKKPCVHTHFVDGPIRIAKMEISGTQKTFLVGGLGAGGTGLYALDITDPTAASEADVASKAMWEIDGLDDPFKGTVGHIYGTPKFARLNDGSAVVIFSSGYMSEKGNATLFIVDAVTGDLVSAIQAGGADSKKPNGLSSPTLYDADGDGVPEYAYAGDLDGRMWKFDLINNSASVLHETDPRQAITSAPVVRPYPLGGQMVGFATGRLLASGDKVDTSTHYVYGIWDGAPDENDKLLTQTLSASNSNGVPVRTVSANVLDYSAGRGHHKGWKVALPSGERVVGEAPFYNNGRYYFLSTNPTVEGGENWIHELVINTGGAPLWPIFDLNEDGDFDDLDLADNGDIPVAKFLGNGIFSQPRLVDGDGMTTTLYVYHPDLPIEEGVPTNPDDPGVSGGHFDFDIYYFQGFRTSNVTVPTEETDSALVCKKASDVAKELDGISDLCKRNPLIADGYEYLSDYVGGSVCNDSTDPKKVEYWHTLTCNTTVEVEVTEGSYAKKLHVHEYDDKYDVTGVNMLNASDPDFNLPNAIADPTTPFKVLVLNQYLNPAAFLSVGGRDYESVKTYGNLASETDPATLLNGLPTYTRENIGTLIYNLPLDAFKNKDWWGDGGAVRSGLIPTQTGCVNGVNAHGIQSNPGPNLERFNGALTVLLVKPDTPPEALELNGPDVTYGWRVKLSEFKRWVLVEYTSFWHHPNGECYGDDDWVPDAPEDFDSRNGGEPPPGTADPRDGTFGAGLEIISEEVTVSDDGMVTTTVITYADGTKYIKIVTINDDGTSTTYQKFRDGTEETVDTYTGRGGEAGVIDPNTGSPEEEIASRATGRQTWRDILY
jgi:hypothetical protein